MNPLPTKWLLIPSLTNEHRFLCTQASTALGEAQTPVNCLMRPRSAMFKADLHDSLDGSASMGMLSSF